MQTIKQLSKLLAIAFSITCAVLFLQDKSPIFSFDTTFNKLGEDIMLASQDIITGLHNSYFPSFLKTNMGISIEPSMIEATTLGFLINQPSSKVSSINESSSIWNKVGDQLNLDHAVQNPRVQAEMRKILADKKSFEAILNKSAPYIYYIYTQTQQRHLPEEIALIPIIESEYSPYDHNSIGAMGLWQLMPATARSLGVNTNERRNIIDSTKGALAYYADLGKEFHGNWDLAFAAYNCGDGCVSRAVKKANSDDYFNLGLPLETKIYVPRLLAIAEIIKHADKYGVTLPKIKDAPFFTEVKVNKSENLSDYATSTKTNLDVLKKLNPDFSYEKATSVSPVLLVPVTSHVI